MAYIDELRSRKSTLESEKRTLETKKTQQETRMEECGAIRDHMICYSESYCDDMYYCFSNVIEDFMNSMSFFSQMEGISNSIEAAREQDTDGDSNLIEALANIKTEIAKCQECIDELTGEINSKANAISSVQGQIEAEEKRIAEEAQKAATPPTSCPTPTPSH